MMECIRDDFEQDCQPNRKKLIDTTKMQVDEDGESRPPAASAAAEAVPDSANILVFVTACNMHTALLHATY